MSTSNEPIPVLARQFDPLLRELMAFSLVQKEERADGVSWVLTPTAQRRLSELDHPIPEASSMFVVGHRCDGCREHTVTRRVGDQLLCARCQALPEHRAAG
ncbi:MAG: hypothetical protein M0Z82_07360 [Actinomycetota bacterium]|jgi:formylmethanofuran dehydrogenase subunit E|nr:hypothetical protein [Actinomycetota bacterium]